MSLNILIVDDSRTVREVMKKMLKMSTLEIGEIVEASNGVEGLKLMDEDGLDLVLTDINMPEMTGQEMIEKMAADEVLSRTPVVVVSTDGSMSRMNRLLELGIRGYVRKPFSPNSLETVIRRAVEVSS